MGTKNTDLVANFEATPQVKNNAAELHGVLRTAHGTVELAAGDSDNDDIVMLAPIPSNAAVPSLFVGSDTFGGSATFNVGIYTTAGAVKDEDVFATDPYTLKKRRQKRSIPLFWASIACNSFCSFDSA